ncbi:P-type DNA transfer protein VirB5 [Leisingera daeponensis]|uniref:P-type DNA transfer protein VirB5 n=1 Tax=Leisingera daeponensis TaxID=405746 RepID=A0ABS7NL84_9RHOB|nr:P-type DNA transfer protein VirB5 [Leisingera daeponensis]MBY6141964.1 P-type DNA transfer protein VirB5 [Leisingera daeponensis]
MKKLLLTSAVALTLSCTGAHAAGVPVVDATAIANAKAQFAKELAQMAKELEEARRLYDSVNGLTSMDDIAEALNDPKVRELLGADAMRIASAFDVDLDGLGELAGAARDVYDHASLIGADISAEDFYRNELERIKGQSARNAAMGDRILQVADDRLSGLEKLRMEIGRAETQKEINALNARLSVEQAMLQNDTNRIQGLAMLQEAQTKAEAQRQRQVELQMIERERAAAQRMFQNYPSEN